MHKKTSLKAAMMRLKVTQKLVNINQIISKKFEPI